MKIYKSILLIALMMTCADRMIAQNKKSDLFILADTINVIPENKFLEMGSEGSGRYFTFLCKCIPPYDSYTTFGYMSDKTKVVKSITKPTYKYVSWKDLAEILYKEGKDIPNKYNIFITEVLPDKSYRTDNVKIMLPIAPIVDFQIIKP